MKRQSEALVKRAQKVALTAESARETEMRKDRTLLLARPTETVVRRGDTPTKPAGGAAGGGGGGGGGGSGGAVEGGDWEAVSAGGKGGEGESGDVMGGGAPPVAAIRQNSGERRGTKGTKKGRKKKTRNVRLSDPGPGP
jgi:hypothetical protein